MTSRFCCSPPVIPNNVDVPWMANGTAVVPFQSDQIASITGYVLNNGSSPAPVTVQFLRGGTAAPPLPFNLTVQPGQYKSFTISGVDTIKINPFIHFATGELNITVNFNPY